MFCGIGGFRLGLEASSKIKDTKDCPNNEEQCPSNTRYLFRCVWGNDNDRYACQIYRKHWGEVCEGDIRTVDVDAIPEHDLLCAGFPCQSFSIAGKRRGFEDTRGTLFFEICRVIRAKRPSYLLLENVKGLLSHDNGETFKTIIYSLDELGYDCQWQVLNSKDFGVPQNRERVFIVGHTRGKPRPKVFPLGEASSLGKNSTWAYAIDSNIYKGVRGHRRRTMIEVRTLQGGAHSGGYHSDMTILVEGKSNIRRLTPIECERLQGFPDDWTEGISDTQRYKCLGNAVTVNVLEAIGRQMVMELKFRKMLK